jgi:DHA2 family multidrug resistance protein
MMPKVMKRVEPRLLVTVGFVLFIAGSMLAANVSGNFSGPQFLASSLVRAVAQAMVMTPLSATAVAGIEREYAGSASALFNMVRNLGGAIGIAVLQTFLTKRDQFHSDVLTAQVSLLNNATRTRLNGLTDTIMRHGVSDPAYARHEAMVMVGRSIHQQAMMLAYSDTVILQSILLGLALFAVLFLKNAKTGSAGKAR